MRPLVNLALCIQRKWQKKSSFIDLVDIRRPGYLVVCAAERISTLFICGASSLIFRVMMPVFILFCLTESVLILTVHFVLIL